jgi:hypothetical protein
MAAWRTLAYSGLALLFLAMVVLGGSNTSPDDGNNEHTE